LRESLVKQKTGTASYLQLVRKTRDGEAGRHKLEVLHHFGRTDQLDKEMIRRLIKSFSRFLDGADAVEARTLAGLAPEIECVGARAIGATWFLDGLWKRLHIDRHLGKLLAKRGFETPIERLLFAMVADRAVAPSSKLAMEDWVARDVVIPELEAVTSDQLYRAMDFLLEADPAIQEAVFFGVANLLNLQVDVIFLDTTATYFEIEDQDEAPGEDAAEGGDEAARGSTLRRRGHSKDSRPGQAQVVIGLAMTKEGIPVRCWVWPGNTDDKSVVDEVKRDLNGWNLGRVITVADAGFNGTKNRARFQTAGGHFILGEKLRGIKDNERVLSNAGRYKKLDDGLEIKEVKLDPESTKARRFVVVRNPEEATRDKAKRDDIVAEAERRLAALKQLDGEAHEKKACALRSHETFGRYVTQTPKTGVLTLDRAKIAEEALLDGKFLVSTSDEKLSPEEIVAGYKALWRIERAFRDLKHVLDVRPVRHRLDDRIRAHVLLCWLALLLVRVAENEAKTTWGKLRAELGRHMLCGYRLPQGEVWQTSTPTAAQAAAYAAVQVKPPPRHYAFTLAPRPAAAAAKNKKSG
jgi:hypothetical protein